VAVHDILEVGSRLDRLKAVHDILEVGSRLDRLKAVHDILEVGSRLDRLKAVHNILEVGSRLDRLKSAVLPNYILSLSIYCQTYTWASYSSPSRTLTQTKQLECLLERWKHFSILLVHAPF
jgi:hypothetical protein